MAPSKLKQIADELRHAVRTSPLTKAWIMYTLPGGLDIVYGRDLDQSQYRLALRREGVPPSSHEVDICADVFAVPPETTPNAYTRREEHPATKRKITYHVVELVWRELESVAP